MKKSNNSKSLKNVNVKGGMVQGADGAHYRNPYHRKMLVNNQAVKYPQITKQLNNSLRSGTIDSVSDMVRGGVTHGVKYIKLNDNGKEMGGYFKDIQNDPFTSSYGGFMRSSVRLNDRKTNETKNDAYEYAGFQKKEDGNWAELKGHMMNREVATYTLAKALKMDHIPDATGRRIDVDGQKKLGILVRDIKDQFKSPGRNQILAKDARRKIGISSVGDLQRSDPNLGDKLAFDLLIGNMDRHQGNQMVDYNPKDLSDARMLCFDQGLSFPNSNRRYVENDFGNQTEFYREASTVNMSGEFAENLINFLSGDDYDNFIKYVEDQIGVNEATAFNERAELIARTLFEDQNFSVMQSNFKRKFRGY